MGYKERSKYKNIGKRYLYNISQFIKKKSVHLSNGGKSVVFGLGVCIVSLFMTWVDSIGEIAGIGQRISGNAFSEISGQPGFIISLTIAGILFSLFSIYKKEKVKLISNFYFQDYWAPIIGGLIILILGFNAMNFIGGLQIFSSDIIHGKGPILCMTGSIIIIVGGVIMKKEFSHGNRGSFMSDVNEENTPTAHDDKKNMKLPF